MLLGVHCAVTKNYLAKWKIPFLDWLGPKLPRIRLLKNYLVSKYQIFRHSDCQTVRLSDLKIISTSNFETHRFSDLETFRPSNTRPSDLQIFTFSDLDIFRPLNHQTLRLSDLEIVRPWYFQTFRQCLIPSNFQTLQIG